MSSPTYDDSAAIEKLSKLFEELRLRHRSAYPDSSINFDDLNITQRVTQSRSLIGRGHFSDVYRGEFDDSITVALKVLRLPAYGPGQDEFYETVLLRFFRELNYWANLQHLNVARMLGYTFDQGNIALVSLYYPKGNLVQYLQSNPDASKPDLALDVAEGIQYLHSGSQPLIHGDLKAGNIFIDANGVACIGDFGISKQIRDLERTTGFSTTSGVSGTIPWMAPELLYGATATLASDMYAYAGVILEIWCSGKSPYHYMTRETDVIMAKYKGELPDRQHYPELENHNELWDFLIKCWSDKPEDRPHIQDIVQSLYQLFELNPRIVDVSAQRPRARPTGLGSSESAIGVENNILHSVLSEGITYGVEPDAELDLSPGQELLLCKRVAKRQKDISGLLEKTNIYLQDLRSLDRAFFQPLWKDDPPGILPKELNDGMRHLFQSFSKLCAPSERLVGALAAYQREPEKNRALYTIGRIILRTVEDFTEVYPSYIALVPDALKKLHEELEFNWELRELMGDRRGRSSIMQLIERPAQYVQEISKLGSTFLHENDRGGSEHSDLLKALSLVRSIFGAAELRAWQSAMGKTPVAQMEWWHPVIDISAQEIKRQSIIFEVVRSEIEYVTQLGNIGTILLPALRYSHNPPFPGRQLGRFIRDIFYNINSILLHHRILLGRLYAIQRAEYPLVGSIVQQLLDTLNNVEEAYVKYITHFPIAKHHLESQEAKNATFKSFNQDISTIGIPGKGRVDIRHVISRPRDHPGRYILLLQSMDEVSPSGHKDRDLIAQAVRRIQSMSSKADIGMGASQLTVELWRFKPKLVPRSEEESAWIKSLNLSNKNRTLVYTGWLQLWREERWSDIFLLLLDNYLVLTEREEHESKSSTYHVYTQPISIEDIVLVDFETREQPPSTLTRPTSSMVTRGFSPSTPTHGQGSDGLWVRPGIARQRGTFLCIIGDAARKQGSGEVYHLSAESARAQTEWKKKIMNTRAMRLDAVMNVPPDGEPDLTEDEGEY